MDSALETQNEIAKILEKCHLAPLLARGLSGPTKEAVVFEEYQVNWNTPITSCMLRQMQVRGAEVRQAGVAATKALFEQTRCRSPTVSRMSSKCCTESERTCRRWLRT
jgi:hypothetical protein